MTGHAQGPRGCTCAQSRRVGTLQSSRGRACLSACISEHVTRSELDRCGSRRLHRAWGPHARWNPRACTRATRLRCCTRPLVTRATPRASLRGAAVATCACCSPVFICTLLTDAQGFSPLHAGLPQPHTRVNPLEADCGALLSPQTAKPCFYHVVWRVSPARVPVVLSFVSLTLSHSQAGVGPRTPRLDRNALLSPPS